MLTYRSVLFFFFLKTGRGARRDEAREVADGERRRDWKVSWSCGGVFAGGEHFDIIPWYTLSYLFF